VVQEVASIAIGGQRSAVGKHSLQRDKEFCLRLGLRESVDIGATLFSMKQPSKKKKSHSSAQQSQVKSVKRNKTSKRNTHRSVNDDYVEWLLLQRGTIPANVNLEF
jgi:hypothetical protein